MMSRDQIVNQQSVLDMLAQRRVKFHKATKPSTASNGTHRAMLIQANDQRVAAKQQPTTRVKQDTNAIYDQLLHWRMVRKVGPGLVNLGNTCYLNSVLQCLTYTPVFSQMLLSDQRLSRSTPNGGFCAIQLIRDHISKMFAKKGAQQPRKIVMNLRRFAKHFRMGRQEDSHEFLRHFLDGMQRSCLRSMRIKEHSDEASTTLIHRVFGGRLRSRVACGKCPYVSDTYQSFLDISLEVTKGVQDVRRALRMFTAVEQLDASNAWRCSNCNKMSQAKKQLTIQEAPNVLVLQLKRFSHYGKLSKHVAFQEKLELGSAMSQKSPALYNLYAVLVHSGSSMNSGHYYAFVKDTSGSWYEMNDSSVRWVSVQTVLKQQAYMLFYTRQAPVKPKTKIETPVATKAPVVAVPEKKKVVVADPKPLLDASLICTSKAKKVEPIVVEEKVRAKVSGGPQFCGNIRKFIKFALPWGHYCRDESFPLRRKIENDGSKSPEPAVIVTPTDSPARRGESTEIEPKSQKIINRNQLKRSEEGQVHFVKTEKTSGQVDLTELTKKKGLYGAAEVKQWNDESDGECHTSFALQEQHNRLLRKATTEDVIKQNEAKMSHWDALLDTGRVKKIRKRKEFVANVGKKNPFQMMAKKKAKRSH